MLLRKLHFACTLNAALYFAIGITTIAFATPTFATQAVAEQDAAEQEAAQTSENAQEETKSEKDVKSKKRKKNQDSAHFMRIRKDAKGRAVALETSITRYEMTNEKGIRITVDLIGAVHIGEEKYFATLNERFKQYESMLYELVAPEGTVIPKGGGRSDGIPTNPIAMMQKGMQSALGLEFQLEHIDYTKGNFVHADMTPAEFSQSMKKNDESVSKYMVRAIGQSMALQSAGRGDSSMDMVFAMFSSNKELRMRRAFAKQIQDMEAGMVVFKGKDGSTIIDHRNAKCMKILEREIAAGKRNIAIFYGAGHLPDMQRRLINDFEMKRGGQVWLEAWSLTNRGKKK
ncbi:MAG: hypothetical protein AB8B55_05535 [Mariniblastus sp.]